MDDPEVVVVDGDVNETPDAVEVNEGDTTVIVEPEPADDAVDAVIVDHAIDTAAELARLNARIDEVERVAYEARSDAAIAQIEVDELHEADAAIVEAADDAIVDAIESAEIDEGNPLTDDDDTIEVTDKEPLSARVHPLFRSWHDWRNRG